MDGSPAAPGLRCLPVGGGGAPPRHDRGRGGARHLRGIDRPPPARAVHLLPAFDEWLVGYRDRSAAIDDGLARRLVTRNGIFSPCIVWGGRVVGLWSRGATRATVEVELAPFRAELPAGVAGAVRRYGEFLGRPARAARGTAPLTPAPVPSAG